MDQSNPTTTSSQLPLPAAQAASQAVRTAIAEASKQSSSLSSSASSSSASSSSTPSSSTQPHPTTNSENSATEKQQPPAPTKPNQLKDQDDHSDLEEGEIRQSQTQSQIDSTLSPITVFSSQTEFNVKHPLYSSWTLWFDNASKNDKAKNWDDLIQKVLQVESVEEFWGLYNNIVPPSMIHVGSNYYLFKEGIRPAWEDPANQKGGSWSIQIARERCRDAIDTWWLYTMLAAIGETFETPYSANGQPPSPMSFTDEVTGVVVSSRKMFFRISIWTRSSDSQEIAQNIGRHFKYGVLGVPQGHKFPGDGRSIQTDCEFKSHADAQQKKKKVTWTV